MSRDSQRRALMTNATVADFDALGGDVRAELIDGVLYILPMTTFEHDVIKSGAAGNRRAAPRACTSAVV